MFLTVKEASDLTGKSATTIYRLCNKRRNSMYIRKEDNKFLIDKEFLLASYPPIEKLISDTIANGHKDDIENAHDFDEPESQELYPVENPVNTELNHKITPEEPTLQETVQVNSEEEIGEEIPSPELFPDLPFAENLQLIEENEYSDLLDNEAVEMEDIHTNILETVTMKLPDEKQQKIEIEEPVTNENVKPAIKTEYREMIIGVVLSLVILTIIILLFYFKAS
jgi:hypothetical protein